MDRLDQDAISTKSELKPRVSHLEQPPRRISSSIRSKQERSVFSTIPRKKQGFRLPQPAARKILSTK